MTIEPKQTYRTITFTIEDFKKLSAVRDMLIELLSKLQDNSDRSIRNDTDKATALQIIDSYGGDFVVRNIDYETLRQGYTIIRDMINYNLQLKYDN